MMTFAPGEKEMWAKSPADNGAKLSDDEINEKYIRGEGRIIIETNREKIPGFVNSMKAKGYLDLRPFYQRRKRWAPDRQSLLIESFIMNIPVPPVFLYERDYNSYEVMDGQQRITALRDFYANKFALTGLTEWPEINGRTYDKLPDKIRAGLDRRSISSVVMLRESTSDEESVARLRETVFERLNTGGVRLSRQEIRNALYPSKFNDLLEELSRLPIFRKAWGIPAWVENEIDVTPGISDNTVYKTMEDMELVLRFFALRHVKQYRRGMAGFLDLYMQKAEHFSANDLEVLRKEFTEALNLAAEIYGDDLFRPYDPATGAWQQKPQIAFADAVLVGLANLAPISAKIRAKKGDVMSATKQMFADNPPDTFTGRGNSKADVQNRIDVLEAMINKAVA